MVLRKDDTHKSKKERNGIDHVAANKEKGKYDHTGRRK
jgi:hypothetical protein